MTAGSTAVFNNPEAFEVLGLAVDGQVCRKYHHSGRWLPNEDTWELLGGQFNGMPEFIFRRPDLRDVFCLGKDSKIYRKSWAGLQIPPTVSWEVQGDIDFRFPPVGLCVEPQMDLFVFAVATDREMYMMKYSDDSQYSRTTSTWQRLGGRFMSRPSVVTTSPGRFHVFCLGSHQQVLSKSWSFNHWDPGWRVLGGNFMSAPTAIARGFDTVDVFCMGNNGEAWCLESFDPYQEHQNPWVSLGIVE